MAKIEWAPAGTLEPGTKVHKQSMGISMTTLEGSPVRTVRGVIGDRFIADKGKRHERPMVAVVHPDTGQKLWAVRLSSAVALGWPA